MGTDLDDELAAFRADTGRWCDDVESARGRRLRQCESTIADDKGTLPGHRVGVRRHGVAHRAVPLSFCGGCDRHPRRLTGGVPRTFAGNGNRYCSAAAAGVKRRGRIRDDRRASFARRRGDVGGGGAGVSARLNSESSADDGEKEKNTAAHDRAVSQCTMLSSLRVRGVDASGATPGSTV
jgi:hypothetical protein